MKLTCPFVLASRSPRRKKLLEGIGLTFTVQESQSDEVIHAGMAPQDVVQALAREKAEDVAALHRDALTLGADTIVVLDGDILVKPVDPEDAVRMLQRLSGRAHTVYTGIALVHPASNRIRSAYVSTEVRFASLDEQEIRAYVATGSPMDKAGAYGIQDDLGALFIADIRGDYYNVVGLPLNRTYRLIRDEFPDLFVSL